MGIAVIWEGGKRKNAKRTEGGCGALTRRSLQDTYKLPHRLIEKKRRDRINECIAQLKDLLPEHLKLTVRALRAPLRGSGPGLALSARCRRGQQR